jgi:hypothetical protein
MDHIKILKRALNITWFYRALWIFGIILALTTGGNGGNGPQGTFEGNGNGGPSQEFQWPEEFPRLPFEEVPSWKAPEELIGALAAVSIGLVCFVFVLIIVSVIARYVSETALIRMVDDYEETGEKRGIREGFRLGWSRSAWRLFLIDLLLALPTIVVFLLLLLLVGGLIFVGALAIEKVSVAVGVIGIVAGVGLFFLILLLIFVVVIVLSLLMPFFRRACVLGGMGVIESIQEGSRFVRRHLKDVGIMWLLMIGLGIAWIIVMIPAVIGLILAGVAMGGLPALLVGGLASLVAKGAVPWVLGSAVGIPICALVVAVPLVLVSGLKEVFKSSTWTLTYRELRALEALETKTEIETTAAEEQSELDEPGSSELAESS